MKEFNLIHDRLGLELNTPTSSVSHPTDEVLQFRSRMSKTAGGKEKSQVGATKSSTG